MSVIPIDGADAKPHVKYDQLIAAAKQVPAVITLGVHPCDESSLQTRTRF